VWRYTWRRNWVNCAVLTGNSARPQNCPIQSSFTQRTSQFTQGIPQYPQFTCRHLDGIISRKSSPTSVSSSSFSRWALPAIFLFKYHFLLHILRFLFCFSENITADVASKQQTTALFYPPQSHAQEDTELTTKLKKLMGKLWCAREYSVQFFMQFFTQLNCTV